MSKPEGVHLPVFGFFVEIYWSELVYLLKLGACTSLCLQADLTPSNNTRRDRTMHRNPKMCTSGAAYCHRGDSTSLPPDGSHDTGAALCLQMAALLCVAFIYIYIYYIHIYI